MQVPIRSGARTWPRRRFLLWAGAGAMGLWGSIGLGSGCAGGPVPPMPVLPSEDPTGDVHGRAYADNVDALFDVILPAERDTAGTLLSPGAREAGVDQVWETQGLVRLLVTQGLLPPLADAVITGLDDLRGAVRGLLNRELDVLALVQKPLTAFRDLDRPLQEQVVRMARGDARLAPPILVARAACFLAYLGAVSSDTGLVAVGFPPFEDFADRRAVSGYPRTREGRLVDASTEDLAALAAAGDLDDYTYNQQPAATVGDDLSGVLDAAGDLR